MTGGVVSTTLTKFVQSALFPQQSTAFQMAVMVSWHVPVLLVVTFASTMETLVPQHASKAVGGSSDHVVLPHCTVWLLAQVMTGGVVSMTVTVWLHVAELLQQSVACHVRVMIKGQILPALVIVLRTVIVTLLQQASTAVGGVNAQAEPHCTVMLLAQFITGGWVSCSTTRWLQTVEFEQQSVISQKRS
jgi:hypothetical protein